MNELLAGLIMSLNQINDTLTGIHEELKKQNDLTEEANLEAKNAEARRVKRSEYGLGRP